MTGTNRLVCPEWTRCLVHYAGMDSVCSVYSTEAAHLAPQRLVIAISNRSNRVVGWQSLYNRLSRASGNFAALVPH
jgi:hypothetical protein